MCVCVCRIRGAGGWDEVFGNRLIWENCSTEPKLWVRRVCYNVGEANSPPYLPTEICMSARGSIRRGPPSLPRLIPRRAERKWDATE